jgi:hypothetical protein
MARLTCVVCSPRSRAESIAALCSVVALNCPYKMTGFDAEEFSHSGFKHHVLTPDHKNPASHACYENDALTFGLAIRPLCQMENKPSTPRQAGQGF